VFRCAKHEYVGSTRCKESEPRLGLPRIYDIPAITLDDASVSLLYVIIQPIALAARPFRYLLGLPKHHLDRPRHAFQQLTMIGY